LFGLLAAAQVSAQSIVGAWTSNDSTVEGASVVVFFANGYFFQIQNAKASEAPHGFDGFERGTYSWNQATGAFTVTVLQDLNGDTGLSNISGLPGITLGISGDTATINLPGSGSVTATRVTGMSPIVGAWGGASGAANSSGVFVFLPNGVYFMAEDGDSSPVTGDPSGHDGIEHGTYTWNPTTGAFTSRRTPAPYVDTNGAWGLSNPQGAQTFKVSADGLTLTGGDSSGSFSLPRVGAAATPAPANYQGLWWTAPGASESGWGLTVTHQGDAIFLGWFTYDATGKGWWLSMTATRTAASTYSGTLIQSSGPAFNAVPFDAARVTRNSVGTGTLTFSDASNGSFAYTVNAPNGAVTQVKPITRVAFDVMPACSYGAQPDFTHATNYQDVWWVTGGAEGGWGLALTHQGDVVFTGWFTYDLDGTPLWLSASAPKTGPGVYTGSLVRTTGPAFSAVPWDPSKVIRTTVGTMMLAFANGNSGSFAYTVNTTNGPVTQTKSLTRALFVPPAGTLCQ
jgi:hypothetical protein